jgi:YD repeat-containing protein
VTTRIIAVLFVFGVLLCACSVNVAAQEPDPCKYPTQFCVGMRLSDLPAGAACYTGPSFMCTPCSVRTYQCPPVNGPDETRCRTCNAATVGQPIELATGNTYIVQTDLSVPGIGGGLTLVRTWNSKWAATQSGSEMGLFGLNWRSNYEEQVFVGSDGTVKYARGDGSFWSFGYDPIASRSGSMVYQVAAPVNGGATLISGTDYWTLTFKNGEKRLFSNAAGSLISIIDRNGNTTQLSYDAINRIVTITDPGARHLYFNYTDNSTYRIVSVTSDVGMTLVYSYDNQGRLLHVTKPDNTVVTFEYNDQSLISAVRDNDGKILESHTYDSHGRGLTSSRAGGVDSVVVSYPDPPLITE